MAPHLLSGHPDVYMPERRKEIRFFDRNHDQGTSWYEAFFCPQAEAARYAAIGEISPQYLYCEACPDRIAALLPDAKLLVILRHPVDRAYSHYGFVVQRRNYRGIVRGVPRRAPDDAGEGVLQLDTLTGILRDSSESACWRWCSSEPCATTTLPGENSHPSSTLPLDRFPSSVGRVNASTVPRFGSLSNGAVSTGTPSSRNTSGTDRRSRSPSRRAGGGQQGQGASTSRRRSQSLTSASDTTKNSMSLSTATGSM